MRDFELASLALIAWTLLYDLSTTRTRAAGNIGVECLDNGGKFVFKISGALSWLAIDFMDYWNSEHYHIYSVGDMRYDKFEIVHTFDKNFKITFELFNHYKWFKIEKQNGEKYFAYLDERDDNKVIVEVTDHTRAKWHYHVRAN